MVISGDPCLWLGGLSLNLVHVVSHDLFPYLCHHDHGLDHEKKRKRTEGSGHHEKRQMVRKAYDLDHAEETVSDLVSLVKQDAAALYQESEIWNVNVTESACVNDVVLELAWDKCASHRCPRDKCNVELDEMMNRIFHMCKIESRRFMVD